MPTPPISAKFLAFFIFAAAATIACTADAGELADEPVIHTLASHRFDNRTVAGDGETIPLSISEDGRTVLFVSSSQDLIPYPAGFTGPSLYLWHAENNTIDAPLIRYGDLGPIVRRSVDGLMSGNAQFILFGNGEDDVVPGQIPAEGAELFLMNRSSGETKFVTHDFANSLLGTDGALQCLDRQCAISPNGRFVAYTSNATRLVEGFVNASTQLDAASDIFLYDSVSNTNVLVNRSSEMPNRTGNNFAWLVGMSPNGRFVVFNSLASDHVAGQVDEPDSVHAFVFDRTSGDVRMLTHAAGTPHRAANGPAVAAALSEDGRTVVVASTATDLDPTIRDLPGTYDVFAVDLLDSEIVLVSHLAGAPHDTVARYSEAVGISADGDTIVFNTTAAASEIDPGTVDHNETIDAFAWSRQLGESKLILRVPNSSPPRTGDQLSSATAISADGRRVSVDSNSTDLGYMGFGKQFIVDLATHSSVLFNERHDAPRTGCDDYVRGPLMSTDASIVASYTECDRMTSDDYGTERRYQAIVFTTGTIFGNGME